MKKILPAFLLLLTAAGGAQARLEPYAPLAVGLKWRHSVELRLPRGEVRHEEMTNEITGTRSIAGKRWYVNVSHVYGPKGTTSHTSYYRPAPDGIHTLGMSGQSHYEYLVTPLPLRPGLRWVSGRRDHPTIAVSGEKSIQAGDRKYARCLKVVARSTTGNGVSTSWLVPEVGTVLTESRSRGYSTKTTLRSMTYAPPRAPARTVHKHRKTPVKPRFHLKQEQGRLRPPVD